MSEILEILTDGDPLLRKKAEKVADPKALELDKLIEDMIKTMQENPTQKGVGLAAPQVGKSLRLFVMNPFPKDPNKKAFAVINPEIVSHSERVDESTEACLSVPGCYGIVLRFHAVRVRYIDRQGNVVQKRFESFPAVVFQHELDHLDGILFTDRVESKQDIVEEDPL